MTFNEAVNNRILVTLFDSEGSRELVLTAEENGWQVWQGLDMAEALKTILNQNPALLIVPLVSVVDKGAELIRRLRKGGRKTLIIALAQRHNDQVERVARQAGANLYFPNILDRAILVEAMNQILKRLQESRSHSYPLTG